MTGLDISYINQKNLALRCDEDPSLNDFFLAKFGKDWHFFSLAIKKATAIKSWYPRFGENFIDIPAQQWIDVRFNFEDISKIPTLTFQDATDRRTHELYRRYKDKPWLIYWSGGIDSTVIITSILKNLQPQERKEFAVFCDPSSVWESPIFFQEHILPNFKIIDSTNYQSYNLCDTYYVIDGEPADCLWGNRPAVYLGDRAKYSWSDCIDTLVKSYIDWTGDAGSSQWMVEKVCENILLTKFPVENCFQWYWWINFNFQYVNATTRLSLSQDRIDMNQSFINWYHDFGYNVWSLQHNLAPGKSYTDPYMYKSEAKDYVNALFKNKYWKIFKNKISSNGVVNENKKPWISVKDDKKFSFDPWEVAAEIDLYRKTKLKQ